MIQFFFFFFFISNYGLKTHYIRPKNMFYNEVFANNIDFFFFKFKITHNKHHMIAAIDSQNKHNLIYCPQFIVSIILIIIKGLLPRSH